MATLICGSLAFDSIATFPGRFSDQILPEKLHILNVSFLVPGLRREFGGCAGNIAYNVKLLGGDGLPMATVGNDFGPYSRWLERCGIDRSRLRTLDDEYTAQAFITTDLDDNQITAFHPGAMNRSHVNVVPTDAGITLGVIAPDGRDGMLQHATQFTAAGIPILFDPGQGLPMFDGAELRQFVSSARWVAVNDYEGTMLSERTGMTHQEIARDLDALIVTRGASGSVIYANGREIVKLQACHPRFFASHRYIVSARLVRIEPRGEHAITAPARVLAAAPLAATEG